MAAEDLTAVLHVTSIEVTTEPVVWRGHAAAFTQLTVATAEGETVKLALLPEDARRLRHDLRRV